MDNLIPDDEYMSGPHAVRWSHRELKRTFSRDYTRWHWTQRPFVTLCGVPVVVISADGEMCEHDDRPERVDCARCRAKLKSEGGT